MPGDVSELVTSQATRTRALEKGRGVADRAAPAAAMARDRFGGVEPFRLSGSSRCAADGRSRRIVWKNPQNDRSRKSRFHAPNLICTGNRHDKAHGRATRGKIASAVETPAEFSFKVVYCRLNCDRREKSSFPHNRRKPDIAHRDWGQSVGPLELGRVFRSLGRVAGAIRMCARAANLPPSTMRYSFRIGRFSNQHSRISRVPAA
jgi:hypothetical protein